MGAAGVEGAGKALEGAGIGIVWVLQATQCGWLCMSCCQQSATSPPIRPANLPPPWPSHPCRVPNLCDKGASSSVSTNMHSS